VILISLVIAFIGLFNRNKALNEKIQQLNSNALAYENLYYQELSANNLLQLSEFQLKKSRDSLLSELGYYIEENRKLKKIKNPEIVQGIVEYIHDTVTILIPSELPEFDITECLNDETCITVKGCDSTLLVIPDISNTIKVEIGVNRVYLNSYKNGWVRFWHFDWKKVDSYEYQIDNSNDIIQLKDVKIIKIN
jgi:hypothetical protein